MRVILNIIWLLLAGIWMAIAYAIAGALLFITIIGIPFGVQSRERERNSNLRPRPSA